MRFVVDTNAIMSAIIKDGASRQILLYSQHVFYTTEYAFLSIEKYKKYLLEKSGLDEREAGLLLMALKDRILLIEETAYKSRMQDAVMLMQTTDIEDAPFVALALAIQADGIWSEDKHFEKQQKIKVFKTKDLLNSLSKE